MRLSYVVWCVVIGGLTGLGVPEAQGDPCGMVPPIEFASQSPIKRIGAQMTYVFYQNNVETIVLRPGFSGNVDEFGMLIPFPSPPAIRKVPDHVFEQIAAAIDPPEIVIDVRPQASMYGGAGMGGGFGGGGGGFGGGGLGFQVPKDEVRVIREEAVGMYEVAVLAAGSAGALKRWMDDHQFAYPSGMDAVCPEYIEQKWCFVAVKTKVNQKRAADPQPGQRAIDNALPEGASFDGHVQAMGFRFHTPQLVVPMRLSVHNPGELRNVVYLLSDNPSKIRNIPEEFVRRQISGFKLFDQMTKPLPLRIIGGTINDLPFATRNGLADQRDPEPHNGVAAELFASDLIAARTRQLESRSEAYEKHLLTINEALKLRGPEIDAAVRRQVRTERSRIVRAALGSIDKMTLTVIDGDFPREVLARENLTFAEYHMPLERSNRSFYDANKLGQAEPVAGSLYVGSLEPREEPQIATVDQQPDGETRWSWLTLVVGIAMTGGLAALRSPARHRAAVVGASALIVVLTSLLSVGISDEKIPALNILVSRLGNSDTAEQAAGQIAQLGERAVPAMIRQSRDPQLVKRGWAIVSLGRIGGEDAMRHLKLLHSNESVPPLVQSWAAAAMVHGARTRGELEELSLLVRSRPELTRPLLLAFRRHLRDSEGGESIEGLLSIGRSTPQLKQGISDALSAENVRASLDKYLRSQSLDQLTNIAGEYPQLGDQIAMEFCRQLEASDGLDPFEARLVTASRSPVLAKSVGPSLVSAGAEPLVRAMLQSNTTLVRRTAAGYVATLGQTSESSGPLAASVVAALKFDPSAKQAPWHNGPLFIPSIPWQQPEAQELVGNLIRWHLWADRNKEEVVRQQIYINLQSVTLASAAGYRITHSPYTEEWLKSWKRVVGAKELKQLLAEQDAEGDFATLLDD
ncbi:MAG: DUF2330 domain-containing protein [Planctomycetota bacterium]|nr:DUF2330 domain-containing protein [Planctomycetota bacterium]